MGMAVTFRLFIHLLVKTASSNQHPVTKLNSIISHNQILNKMVNFLIFGPPGSGKGTQSVRLAEKFNLVHLSTGDMLRAEITAGSELGKRMSTIMSKGELVPDEVVIEMIASKIDKTIGSAGFLFDGFPRTVGQTIELEKMLGKREMKIDLMLVLDVEHDELVSRLISRAELSGRPDDKDPAVIENRISVYKSKTEPIINYCREKRLYQAINGMGTIDDIFKRLSDHMQRYVKER
jgi:adenylate kinase